MSDFPQEVLGTPPSPHVAMYSLQVTAEEEAERLLGAQHELVKPRWVRTSLCSLRVPSFRGGFIECIRVDIFI